MNPVVEVILALLLLTASFFTVVGSVGLVKLTDFFKRLHAPTKATTMGVGSVILASIIYHPLMNGEIRPRELLISLFLFITAPISAHMMAKATLSLRSSQRPQAPGDPVPDPTADDPEHETAGGSDPV